MTNPIDERRARVLAEMDLGEDDPVAVTDFFALDEDVADKYRRLVQAIRESDEAAGLIVAEPTTDEEVRAWVETMKRRVGDMYDGEAHFDEKEILEITALLKRLAAERIWYENQAEQAGISAQEIAKLPIYDPTTHVAVPRGSTKLAEVLAYAVLDEKGRLPSPSQAMRILASVLTASEGEGK